MFSNVPTNGWADFPLKIPPARRDSMSFIYSMRLHIWLVFSRNYLLQINWYLKFSANRKLTMLPVVLLSFCFLAVIFKTASFEMIKMVYKKWSTKFKLTSYFPLKNSTWSDEKGPECEVFQMMELPVVRILIVYERSPEELTSYMKKAKILTRRVYSK